MLDGMVAGAVVGAIVGWLLGLLNLVASLATAVVFGLWGLMLGAVFGAGFGALVSAWAGDDGSSAALVLRAQRYDLLATQDAAAEASRGIEDLEQDSRAAIRS
jgi:hypothetical protein